jgi:hypothetical protein
MTRKRRLNMFSTDAIKKKKTSVCSRLNSQMQNPRIYRANYNPHL